MPSKARKTFDDNLKDIDRLMEFHSSEGGGGRGRRFGLEVLNKSAIMLLTSHWEVFCEDLATEALDHIVDHAKSAMDLPKEIRKLVGKELKRNLDELSVWELSDDRWRTFLQNRLVRIAEERNRSLNTPKHAQVDQLFLEALGLKAVSSKWRWSKKLTIEGARQKLDRYVSLRGEIAHRGQSQGSVTRSQVTDYRDFLQKVADKTDGQVNRHVNAEIGRPLFK